MGYGGSTPAEYQAALAKGFPVVRDALAVTDPTNPMLGLELENMSELMAGMNMSPLGMLVEIFMRPEYPGSARGSRAESVFLAASIAVGRVGPESGAVQGILERFLGALRAPGLERG